MARTTIPRRNGNEGEDQDRSVGQHPVRRAVVVRDERAPAAQHDRADDDKYCHEAEGHERASRSTSSSKERRRAADEVLIGIAADLGEDLGAR